MEGTTTARALRHQRQQARLLAISTGPALRSGDFGKALREITEAGADELSVARVGVWMYDESRSRMDCIDLCDTTVVTAKRHIEGLSLLSDAFPRYFASMRQNRILAAADARQDPRTSEFTESYLVPLGITSMLDAPIRRRGRLLGILCHEHVGPMRSWTIDEQMFAASLADFVAMALDAAESHDEAGVPSEDGHRDPESTRVPSHVLADLSGGDAFGKYKLIAMLGQGGMADVFLALEEGPAGARKLNVIKRLQSAHAHDRELVAMLLDEGRLATRLNHPNVVHTCEVGDCKDSYFIAMEYLEGQPVDVIFDAMTASRAVHERWPIGYWLRIACDALQGLEYAHELRDFDGTKLAIVHRDISPHNLFVTYAGVTKIVDFGIAKAKLNTAQTESGVLKGKLAYMAPEQASLDKVDARADIFALGVVLWELLAGRRLRETGSMRTLYKLVNQQAPCLSTVAKDIDPELETIVACALEPDPARRFPTARAMRESLEHYMHTADKGTSTAELGDAMGELFAKQRDEMRARIHAEIHSEPNLTAAG